MLERLREKLSKNIGFILALLLTACAGTVSSGPSNQAAPPAPLAELPSFLTIPKSVEIDTSKTASGPGGAAMVLQDQAESKTLALKESVGPGPYGGAISFAANVSRFANDRLNEILLPLNAIQIPVSSALQKMDTVVSIGSLSYTVRLDFGDFDIDGDGNTEGCSGNTGQLPICVRVYIFNYPLEPGAYTRFLAARFDAFPTELNIGAGTLRGHDVNFPAFQVRADYNHVNPEVKFTDAFMGFIFDPANPSHPDADSPSTALIYRFRAFVSQIGPDASALKTANGTSPDFELSGPGYRGQGFGRWFEDKDFWLGSFDSDDPLFPVVPSPYHFDNLCALISTGDATADQNECKDNGLDISDLRPLPPPVLGDVKFYDFPPTPP
ncbi:MAG: hypothetical protein U1F66_00890 [bacterium]